MPTRKKKESKETKPPVISLYEVLEIERDATPEAIRSSYKKLCLKYHPDKNPTGGEKFKEVNRAHEILSDPEKRGIYDKYGEEGVTLSETSASFQPTLEVQWQKFAIVWVIFVILDYLFGIALEWIAVVGVTLFLLFQLKGFKAESMLAIIVVDVVLYLIIPTNKIPILANGLLYMVLLIWSGLVGKTKSADVTLALWFGLIAFDRYFDRVPAIFTPFGAHCIAFSVAFCALMIIFFQSQLVPDIGSSYLLRGIVLTLNYVADRNQFISTLAIPLWLIVWLLDGFFDISVEWIPFSILAVLSMWKWPYLASAAFASVAAIIWYYLPMGITIFCANFSIQLLTVILLRSITLQMDDEDDDIELTLGQIHYMDYAVFISLQVVDWFFREPPRSFGIFAVISGMWGMFIFGSYILSRVLTAPKQEDLSAEERRDASKMTPDMFDKLRKQFQETSEQSEHSHGNSDKKLKCCENCGETQKKLRLCGGCNAVFYCSQECQRKHWKIHKEECTR